MQPMVEETGEPHMFIICEGWPVFLGAATILGSPWFLRASWVTLTISQSLLGGGTH